MNLTFAGYTPDDIKIYDHKYFDPIITKFNDSSTTDKLISNLLLIAHHQMYNIIVN